LLGDGDASVPGLTAIDAEAILRSARAAKTKPRSRLMGWISGESDDDFNTTTAAPGSLSPPPVAVRREMLRLELEAQVANAQAEVESMAADAALESGRPMTPAAAPEAADASDAAAAAGAAGDAATPAPSTWAAIDAAAAAATDPTGPAPTGAAELPVATSPATMTQSPAATAPDPDSTPPA
jgi:hypothetical protein